MTRILRLPDELISEVFGHFAQPDLKIQWSSRFPDAAFLEDPLQLRTLRSLSLVSRRFESLARPLLFRHVSHFTAVQYAVPDAVDVRQSIELQRRALSLNQGHAGHASRLRLAQMVRTLNLRICGDIGIDQHILPLLEACENVSVVTLNFTRWSVLATQALLPAMQRVCARLEQLPQLNTLDWCINTVEIDMATSVAPLLSIRLPHLETLRLTHFAHASTPLPSRNWFDKQVRAALPKLRYLDLAFRPVNIDTWGSLRLPSCYASMQEAVQEVQDILFALLRNSPDITGLKIRSEMLSDELCMAIPDFILDKLQGLSLEYLGAAAVFRIDPILRLDKLVHFQSDVALHDDAWNRLPFQIARLALSVRELDELDRLVAFLAEQHSLPALSTLEVGVDAYAYLGPPDDDEDDIERAALWQSWFVLKAYAHERNLRLQPGSFAFGWPEEVRREWCV